MLEDIVSDIVNGSSNEASISITEEVCEYERIRNQNIAEIQAALLRQCPSFWEEMNSLKLQPVKKVQLVKKKAAKSTTVNAVRKSRRIAAQASITVSQSGAPFEGDGVSNEDGFEDVVVGSVDASDCFFGKHGCIPCDKSFG